MHFISKNIKTIKGNQRPCDLRRGSSAARLLRSWVRIPRGTWTFVCCECCVLSGRGLCDGLITRPDESYRLARRCVWSRNLENEEAKALYRAVENTTRWVVTPRKQTTNIKGNRLEHPTSIGYYSYVVSLFFTWREYSQEFPLPLKEPQEGIHWNKILGFLLICLD